MNTGSSILSISIVIFSMFILFGCGKNADESRPLSEVKAEAAEMNVDDLREMALLYKETIQDKLEEVNKIKNKIKEIPLKDMLGDQTKELKQELEPVIKSINDLKQRFFVYYSELKEKSGDLKGLDLQWI